MALASWEKSELFDYYEKAVLALTDEMTLHVQVRKDTLERVLGKYGQSTTVELIATIAAYNMVSRVIEALEISVKDAREL